MKSFFLSLFMIATLSSFAQDYDTLRIAVIPLDTTATWSRVLDGHKPVRLTDAQVRQIDSLVNICIAENNNGGQPSDTIGKYIGIHTFKKQLIPSMNNKGEIVVWVNALCEDFIRGQHGHGDKSPLDWEDEVIFIYDGGAGGCFFNVKINLATQTYYGLIVNGI